jgi:hypothetical protein
MPPAARAPLLVLAVAAVGAALAGAAPASTARALAKEGPVEHASHAVLLLAALAWARLAARPAPARWLAAAMAGFLALVLAEELDWGAVYGLPGPGPRLQALLGHRNMHNAARGSSYLLFAAPLALYFARARGPLAAAPGERLAFAAVGALFILGNLTPWEREAQELLEAVLYALLLVVAVRLSRTPPPP